MVAVDRAASTIASFPTARSPLEQAFEGGDPHERANVIAGMSSRSGVVQQSQQSASAFCACPASSAE